LTLDKAVKNQRVFVSAILAATCVAVAIAIILVFGSGPHRVAADGDVALTPLADNHAQVVTTLPVFHRVDQNLMRGAAPVSGGIETLSRLGVKTVVDLRSIYDHTDTVGLAAEQAGLRYYWLPMGVWDPPTDAQAREFVSVVEDESKGPFYVFCDDGLHRTGEMSAIYRVAHRGWTVEDAIKEMDEVGFNPYYYTLRNYVWTYARKFNPQAVPRHARRVSQFE
jgi:protein tyrosine phosphatase (PTP) superfamily phosphohydrolase (DUF442 family)